jgi:hypothetical protein
MLRGNGRGIYIFFHAIKNIREELILAILLIEYVEKSYIGTWSDCSSGLFIKDKRKEFCTGLPGPKLADIQTTNYKPY